MCMEDVRIGRRKVTRQSVIDTNGAAVFRLTQPDNTRTRVAISANGGASGTVRSSAGSVSDLIGFQLNTTVVLVELDVEQYGNLVTGNLFVDDGGVPGKFTITETFLDWTEKASD